MSRVSLIGSSGMYAGNEIPITADIIIGRDSRVCQVVYPGTEKGISGKHCRVQNMNGCVAVTDLGSTNGTFMQSGERLAPNVPRTLQNGDSFYLGDRKNMFTIKVETVAVPTPPPVAVQPVNSMPVQQQVVAPQGNGNNGNAKGKKWIIIGSVAAAVVILFLIISTISASNEAARARDEAQRAQQQLYEEQNKGLLDKTIDAVEGWMNFFD